jgi:hypothetical protein
MKKVVTAAVLALGLMAGASNAATLLNVAGGSNIVLPVGGPGGGYNPTPTTAPLASAGDVVVNTSGLGNGLKLDGPANIIFTFLGKEALYTNILFEGVALFNNTVAAGTSVVLNNVTPDGNGFLPFKFISNGTQDVVNGNVSGTYASIAFKQISASLNAAVFLIFLNDHAPSDADYDDMVVKVQAVRRFDNTPDIPIPAGLVLLTSGLAGLGYMGRSRAKAAVK